MNAWFEWKGEKSSDYGIRVLTQASIVRPQERVSRIAIPGMPGTLVYTEGEDIYDDMLLTVKCYIADASRLDDICGWLKGSGNLELSNRAGGYYKARVNNQVSFSKLLRTNPHMSFTVIFRCHPFWYYKNVSNITVQTSGSFVTNPGSVWSEPVLTVYGTGDADLMVGTKLITLTDIPSRITIDSVVKEAYKDSVLKNNLMSGEFPVLYPGANAISWDGNITKVVVQPNWRTL